MPQAMPVQTNAVTIPDYRPVDRTPTSLMPVDPSLFKNPLESFMQGAEHGMDLGVQIAGMPNAMEKLKAAKQLTQNTEWAMAHPNEPQSQGYAMGPGGPQFRGTDVQMMPDVTNRRALEEARARQAGAGVGLTNAQVAETQANTAYRNAETGFMPLKEALKPQLSRMVDANGNPLPGAYNNEGGVTPPRNGPGNAAATGQNAGNAPSTITVPQFTPPQPGQSSFSPDQVRAWWGANWSDTAKSVQWSPAWNNGQGGWVITHGDKSKDIVPDSLIQQNRGKWEPDMPLESALKLSSIQRQAGQLSNAPTLPSGYQDPQSLASDEAAFSGPNVPPQAAQATIGAAAAPQATSVTGGQGVAPVSPNQQVMPGAPTPTPQGAMPGSTPAAPGQAPMQSAQNPVQGWKDPNAADFGGTRHLIGMQGRSPIFKPDVGDAYIVRELEQDGTEVRQSLSGLTPPERVTPLSSSIRTKQLNDQLILEQDLRKRAQDEGMANVERSTPQQMTDWLNQRRLQDKAIPQSEQKTLYSMVDALKIGEDLKKKVDSMNPEQFGAAAQWWQAKKDKAQGLPWAGKLLGPPDLGLAQFDGSLEAFKEKVNLGMNNGRINKDVGQKVLSMIGTPGDNPGTLGARIDGALKLLRPELSREVMGSVSMGKGVPQELVKAASDADHYQQSLDQGQAGAKQGMQENPPSATATPNKSPAPVLVRTKAEFDALPPKTPYIDKNGKPGLKPG